MFTGLIVGTGSVQSLTREGQLFTLQVAAPILQDNVSIGDSIAINGCCLTVVSIDGSILGFNLLQETFARTTFLDVNEGTLVNLEPSLRAGDHLGGHFVTGHVDTVGTIVAFEPVGSDHRLTIQIDPHHRTFLVEKGSIAIDGISLTVAQLDDQEFTFTVWLIPHTVSITNLSKRSQGEQVHLEFDLLGKYALRAASLDSQLVGPTTSA
ncbi:MAG: riboflavin synthase [Puniceicoccaceae bacterium]